MLFYREMFVIAVKEFILETKQKNVIGMGFFFSILLAFVFSLSFVASEVDAKIVAGLLWIAQTFTTILVVNRSLHTEQEEHSYLAVLISPINRQAIFWGKCFALFLMLILLQFFVMIMFMVFFQMEIKSFIGSLIIFHIIGTFGLSIATVFVGFMVNKLKGGEIILPVLLLPLLVPLLITMVEISSIIFSAEIDSLVSLFVWVRILAVNICMFLLIPLLFLDYVLEV